MSQQGPLDPTGAWASEHAARRLAEAAAQRIAQLQAATAAFSAARTPEEVAAAALDAGQGILGASRGAVLVPFVPGGPLEVLRAGGDADPIFRAVAAEAFRSCATVLVDGSEANGAIAAFPLLLHDRPLGALVIGLDGLRPLEHCDRALASALAGQCALALDRARLFREIQLVAEAQEDFLNVAAHEVRAPLGTLCLAVRLLARDARARVGPEMEGRARTIERQADRLARLSDALLDLTRIAAGRLELQREPVDLAALVRDAAARLAEDAAAAHCPLAVDAPGPLQALLDPQRLEQVVDNLLSNAFKYGHGTPVRIAARREGDRGVVRVEDGGIGIAPEHQARIFGRFERAVEGRRYPGLGLGLWIIRQIVDAHGGSIRVESAPGQGAAFTLELPLVAG